jgi:DNA-directed RNA polymerase subunit beta
VTKKVVSVFAFFHWALRQKEKLPVTTLFRAIGFERDKDILEIFDLAEEIKVSKTGLKKYIGRKLAARVLNMA